MITGDGNPEETRLGLANAGPIANAALYNNGKELADAIAKAGGVMPGPPTGAAGGALKGTYPNPTLASVTVVASGGSLATFTDASGATYNVHTFAGTQTFTVSSGGVCDVLIVGGGGGGGSLGGGGGAGGLVFRTGMTVAAGSYTVTVGNGGVGGTGGGSGSSGFASAFNGVTAYGGGAGGGYVNAGANGGSGGGNGYGGGIATLAYGGLPLNDSGSFSSVDAQGTFGGASISVNPYLNGGGGGAGSSGGAANVRHAGAGGNGVRNDITGRLIWYAGGGGGGRHADASVSDSTPGGRGMGGGGDGGNAAGAAATPNTGGGGGGGGYLSGTFRAGGAGGSGIVIIRYRTN